MINKFIKFEKVLENWVFILREEARRVRCLCFEEFFPSDDNDR